MEVINKNEQAQAKLIELRKIMIAEGVDSEDNVQELLKLGEQLCYFKEMQKRRMAILSEAKSETTVSNFIAAYTKNIEKAKNQRLHIKNLKEYKAFKNQIEEVDDTNDNVDNSIVDIAETGGNIFDYYDPWLRKAMLNPMRNIKCGHYYDRDSVMSMIKDNASVSCPWSGCTNKEFIQPNHLKADMERRAKIREREANLNPSSSDDEDI